MISPTHSNIFKFYALNLLSRIFVSFSIVLSEIQNAHFIARNQNYAAGLKHEN